MVEELKFLSSLGVGGILAGMLFLAYRADRKSSEERYERLALEFREMVTENTRAITAFQTYIETKSTQTAEIITENTALIKVFHAYIETLNHDGREQKRAHGVMPSG
jgi:hypothetical protein